MKEQIEAIILALDKGLITIYKAKKVISRIIEINTWGKTR